MGPCIARSLLISLVHAKHVVDNGAMFNHAIGLRYGHRGGFLDLGFASYQFNKSLVTRRVPSYKLYVFCELVEATAGSVEYNSGITWYDITSRVIL